jgi:hypothetical protein
MCAVIKESAMLGNKKAFIKATKLGSFFVVLISFACGPELGPETWILLGTGNFDVGRDMTSIGVGPSKGEFSRLRFELSSGAELNWVLVYFEGGEKWSPIEGSSDERGRRLAPGERTFELPGHRLIKRIEVRVTYIALDVTAGYVRVYGWKPAESAIY